MSLLRLGWRLKAETISFQSGESKETTWPSSDAKDQITLTRQSVSRLPASLNGSLRFVGFIYLFIFCKLHLLISWNLPRPAGKHHHFTLTTDFLFYLWIAKSIPVSCPAAAPLVPAKREAHSVHPTYKLTAWNQSDFRRWNEGVKAFLLCLSETGFGRIKRKGDFRVVFFSSSSPQHLDTSNWDFMPYFPRDLKTCTTASSISPRTNVRETVVSFYLFFVALGTLFYLFIYLFIGSEELFDESALYCVWGYAINVFAGNSFYSVLILVCFAFQIYLTAR